MSDSTLNKWLAEGDNAAEAGFTPDPPASPPDPVGAHVFINNEDATKPLAKHWDGANFVQIATPVANVTGLGAGVATFLGTPSSANLKSALTDETGSGAAVFADTPTLVTPLLGTPTSGVLTNCTGLTEAGQTLADNTTQDASTTKHGYVLKATAPASGLVSAVAIGNGETTYSLKPLFDTTNPAALGTAGPGTQVIAARRDHVHANPAIDTLAAATDITTLNASTSAHGLVVKATAPAAGLVNVVAIANGETAYTNKALYDTTAPAALGTAAAGTQVLAARRDHVHAISGCMVRKASDQTGADFTSQTSLTWDQEVYDDNGWHESVTFPARLTVPSGVTRVNLAGCVRIANVGATNNVTLLFAKNGSITFDGAMAASEDTNATTRVVSLCQLGVACVATDYFTLEIIVQTDTSVDITATRSNFTIQAVG